MHQGLSRALHAIALTLCVLAAGGATAAPVLRFGGGVGFDRPSAPEVRDLYGAGPIFFIQQETSLQPRGLRIGLELGYRRSSARLSSPFFVEEAEATLHIVPFTAVVRYPLGGGSTIHPYIGAGLQMLWSKEVFKYTIDGERLDRDPDGTMDPGWVLVGGLERSGTPHPRLEIHYGQVRTERRVTASGSVYDSPGGEKLDMGSFGLRASVAFP